MKISQRISTCGSRLTVLVFLTMILAMTSTIALSQPISLHPVNPHYFVYKGKPLVLITSAEHYGAVINTDIDYDGYLDILKKNSFNLTRIFVGSYCEGNFYDGEPGKTWKSEENQNTLAPRTGKLLAPWARSKEPGYINGGSKFDLDKWDRAYFLRLKDFCSKAADRNIIVELVFFSANYGPATWKNSPLYFANNINGSEAVAYNEMHLPKHSDLANRQQLMVRKIVEEMNNFDNIYFEICNEPYWLNGIPEVEPTIKEQQFLAETDVWQETIAGVIENTERHLPKHHLVAQNFANTYLKIQQLNPRVDVLNFHYAFPPLTVHDNYLQNKPVSFDETFEGLNAAGRRREAWAFVLAGGAVYNNLDWSFAIDDMTGQGRNLSGKRQSGTRVRKQLSFLAKIIKGFDFINARPLDSNYRKTLPEGINMEGLEMKGKDYLLYYYKTKPVAIDKLHLPLAAGKYLLKWINPANECIIKQQTASLSSETPEIDMYPFVDDIVLRITVVK